MAVVAAVLSLCAAGPCRGELPLAVASASLEAKSAPDGEVTVLYAADVTFVEARLDDLRDDEATVEISIRDRDGHGGRRLLEDLEDCRRAADGAMDCPDDVSFRRVARQPPRWRLAIAFRGRSVVDRFRGPVTVRLTYSVSGGDETVHTGTLATCLPARGGPKVTCREKTGTRGGRSRPGP